MSVKLKNEKNDDSGAYRLCKAWKTRVYCYLNGKDSILMNKLEYGISILLSLAMLEFGLFSALSWFWSGFEWSPFGYETCGLEYLLMVVFAFPSFALGLLIRWKFPHYVWYLPLILCGIISCMWFKSLEFGIFCIAVMLFLPEAVSHNLLR